MYEVFVSNLSNPVSVNWNVATDGAYQRYDSATSGTSTTLSITNYVDISNYTYITYSRLATTATNPTSGMAFFDSNQNYICGFTSLSKASQLHYITHTVGVPKNAKYARFSLITNQSSGFSITGYKKLTWCIHDDVSADKEIKLISPKLSMSDNAAGSFTFTTNRDNVGISYITRMQSEISVTRDGDEIWSGRVLTEGKNYWNQREFTCEGELAYLNDILQPPAEYNYVTVSDFLTAIINEYNKNASVNRQFTIGDVDVDAYVTIAGTRIQDTITTTTNYDRTLDVIKNVLLDKYEGHLQVRKDGGIRYLDYHASYNPVISQQITFQDNLTDFTSNWDESEIATAIIPYGEKLDKEEPAKIEMDLRPQMTNYRRDIVSTGAAIQEEGWTTSLLNSCSEYSSLKIRNPGSASLYNVFYGVNGLLLISFNVPTGVSLIDVPEEAYFVAFSNESESYADMKVIATERKRTGLTYKITKERYGNRYKVKFDFTFNNPGVPYAEYYEDGVRHYADFLYNIQLFYKQVGDGDYSIESSALTDAAKDWTMSAGATTNKSWSTTVTGFDPNKTYTWYAEVHQINLHNSESGAMGSDYVTGDHTFTSFFSDDKLDSDENRLTVGAVNNNDIIVKNQNAIDTYGRIEKIVVWDTESEADGLMVRANWYLRSEQFDQMLIEIKAIDLHYLDPSFPAINLLDQVRAISEPHGMDKIFPVTKIEIPLDQPENTVYSFGNVKSTSYLSGGVVRNT